MVKQLSSIVAVVLVSCGGLAAQAGVTVPADLDAVDGSFYKVVPFAVASSRMQLILDRRTVAANSASITSLAFRPENTENLSMPADSATEVVVEISHTVVQPISMNTSFGRNITGSVSTAFVGSLSWPAHTPSGSGVAPWTVSIPLSTPFAYDAGRGNLLIEVRREGSTQFCIPFWIDAHQHSVAGGGLATRFGRRGPELSPEQIDYIVTQGTPGLVPGGSFSVRLSSSTMTPYSGGLVVGLDRLPQPVLLDRLGAPGNRLYISAEAVLPFALIASSFVDAVQFSIPPDPNLVGEQLFTQPFVLDFAGGLGNVLGVSGLEPTEFEIRSGALFPSATCDALSHTSTEGVVRSALPAVVRLFGTFQ